jgi:PAS domain S-box-containing protein
MSDRADHLSPPAVARYLAALGAVVTAFALRILLTPLTGTGAPFVLFFAAVLVTSLYLGTGPGLVALVTSLPIAAYMFVVRAGYPVHEAVFQGLLYAIDGLIVVYITHLTTRRRRTLDQANAELRRLSSEAERSAAHTHEVVELAADAFFLSNLDARFTDVNRAACRLLGYDRDELLGMRIFDILPAEDAARLEATRLDLLVPGATIQNEWRLKRKDGTFVPVEVSTNILEDGRWQAFVRDITERQRAERALRRSEAKFSGIVSIAADAIISVDTDQRITVFNEGAEQIFGYSRQEMIGTFLERLLPERYRTKHSTSFAAFAAGDAVARTMAERREVFGLRKSGEEFPAEASISKVTVGRETFFSVVLRDISYRKSVEEALERAVAARDEVLGIVAHDLKNPLSMIMMTANAMTRRPGNGLDRRDGERPEVILRAAERMNQLIEDLLDVARGDAGQLTVEFALLPAADLARDAVEMQRPLAEASGMKIGLEVEPDVRTAWGERRRLLQVFENLIGNAIKFTQPGGRIVVRVAVKDQDVMFSVTDTGVGIAPAAVPHVFDRFWQATTKARRLGAGLGLTITKGIVGAHDGRIWVESEVGRGTTFFFTIPAAQRSAGDGNGLLAPSRDERAQVASKPGAASPEH